MSTNETKSPNTSSIPSLAASATGSVVQKKALAQRFLPIAEIVTDEEVAGLRMPVITFLGESEELLFSARVFHGELLEVGLKSDLLKQLEDLLHGVRLCHTIFQLERNNDGRGELEQIEARARKLRLRTLQAAELAFFADEEVSAKFDAVRADSIEEDFRGVLIELATLVLQHAAGFTRVRIDASELAAELIAVADDLLATRARIARERAEGTWRDLRDRICVVLAGVVAEVRAHGLYACREEPRRVALFQSRWVKERSRRQRLAARNAKERPENAPSTPVPAAPAVPMSPSPGANASGDATTQRPTWPNGIHV